MSNGCGPSWMPRRLTWLFFGWFFEASCDKHDEGYEEGGDEIRRFVCDWKFLKAMLRDCMRIKRKYLRPLAYLVAMIFFLLVRLGGWYFFNYRRPVNG